MSTDQDHPYSEAVVAGGLVFVSGCLPRRPDGSLVEAGPAALDASVDNVRQRLETLGGSLDDVVKLTYYVLDIGMRDAINQQYLALWDEPRPARTVIAVAALPSDAVVEIDAVARTKSGQ